MSDMVPAKNIEIASPQGYLEARLQLLEKEKALTRARDEVTQERQRLPVVEVTKQYTFTGLDDSGNEAHYSLADLFFGRPQLIVYHAMFDPEWDAACPSCSLVMSSMSELRHLNSRGVTLVAISMAPLEKILQYKKRIGFLHPWVSSSGSEFNYDFCVTVDESKGQDKYNFRSNAELKRRGLPWLAKAELPGHSVFIMGDSTNSIGETGKIYHTYSTYARGNENIIPTFAWLDMTLLGRRDGLSNAGGTGFKRIDEYTEDELKGRWESKRPE